MEYQAIVDQCMKKKICIVDLKMPIVQETNGRSSLMGHGYNCGKTNKQCCAQNCPILHGKEK